MYYKLTRREVKHMQADWKEELSRLGENIIYFFFWQELFLAYKTTYNLFFLFFLVRAPYQGS